MKNSEAELIAAARAARTHLPDLIEENPSEVDARLGELLAEAERGQSVQLALLDLITQHPALRDFVRNVVAVPESLRSYDPLPGRHRVPSVVPRYVCEQHGTAAYRFSSADPEPRCAVDGAPMVRVK